MSPRRSPLFSAVVLAGASLTQALACGSSTDAPKTANDASTQTDGADGGTSADGSGTLDDGGPADASCPDGSELPVPPCVMIL